jgi:hypothetical protein
VVDGGIVDEAGEDIDVLRAGEGPGGVESAAGGHGVELDLGRDALGDFEGAF